MRASCGAPATGPVPVQLGTDGFINGWPTFVFVLGLLLVVGLWVARSRARSCIDHRHHGPRDHRRGHRQDRPDRGQPATRSTRRLEPRRPGAARQDIIATPHLDTVGHFSLFGSFERVGIVAAAILLIFTLMLADFFDTMGTMTAIGAEAGLLDEEGTAAEHEKILVVDSVAAAAGGAAGVSSNTSYIESASGVGEGARTGLASVVTGALFLLSMVFAPLVRSSPPRPRCPRSCSSGFLMMQQVKEIDWDDLEIAIPAFLTIVLMPFTYSITVGIGAGFVAYVLIKAVRGKAASVHPLMWLIAFLFVLYFAIDPIKPCSGSETRSRNDVPGPTFPEHPPPEHNSQRTTGIPVVRCEVCSGIGQISRPTIGMGGVGCEICGCG
jgi:AGZA family xanthine/uracil permease-like MFS transporter